jgi:N-acyl-D-aspartate/D-glutamate deacylase
MYDVLIKGGRVVDGSGSPWFSADVAISGGKIVKVGRGLSGAAETIDAAGKVVSPGFIDAHTHSDVSLIAWPRAESKVFQGVTTEVIGNCGSSPAPMVGEARERVVKQLAGTGAALDWTGLDGYLGRLERDGVAVNVVPLVGFGTVRQVVMGKDTDRPATTEERSKMRALVQDAVAQGAFGMSSMVDFTSKPQGIAPTEEVIEAAKGLKPQEALYVTHIRDEFDLKIGYAASLAEAVEIGKSAGVPTHISHLHALGVPKRASQYVAVIDKFRDSGLDVTADCYPYAVSAAGIRGHRAFMPIVMPAWALEGGRAKALSRLADKATREKIAQEIRVTFVQRGAERHVVRLCVASPELEGLNMAQIASSS